MMKRLFTLVCLMAFLLCGCSQSDSEISSISNLESLNLEPYYMEDVQCLYENGIYFNLLNLDIISVEDERNLENVPVLLVSYTITNNTAKTLDAKDYQIQHLEVLQNYQTGGEILYLLDAKIDYAAFPVKFNDFYDESIKPDTTRTYLSAFKITEDLETVTLRFIADDAANPLGVETYTLSQIIQDGTNMD